MRNSNIPEGLEDDPRAPYNQPEFFDDEDDFDPLGDEDERVDDIDDDEI